MPQRRTMTKRYTGSTAAQALYCAAVGWSEDEAPTGEAARGLAMHVLGIERGTSSRWQQGKAEISCGTILRALEAIEKTALSASIVGSPGVGWTVEVVSE